MVRTKTMDNILQFATSGGIDNTSPKKSVTHSIKNAKEQQTPSQRSASYHNEILAQQYSNKDSTKTMNTKYSMTLKGNSTSTLNNLDKLEKLIQSSRSNFESDESYQVGTDFAIDELIKGDSSIYNSFSVNKKGDVIINYTMNGGFGKINTEKKKECAKTFFQSTDRGINIKKIEKIDRRVSPNIFNNPNPYKTAVRNISKTPKQNKPRVVAYSPRSNIGYYFNEKVNQLKDPQHQQHLSRDQSFSDLKPNFNNTDEKQIKKRKHNSYMNNLVVSSKPIEGNSYNKSLLERKNNTNNSMKNRSVMFENKTNAQTKISVSELLSFKKNDKGRIVNTNTNLKSHDNLMLKPNKTAVFNIKYV
jgi:hypothetical protein